MSHEDHHITNSCHHCGGSVRTYFGLDGFEAKCIDCSRFQPDLPENGHYAPGGQSLPPDLDDRWYETFREAA